MQSFVEQLETLDDRVTGRTPDRVFFPGCKLGSSRSTGLTLEAAAVEYGVYRCKLFRL